LIFDATNADGALTADDYYATAALLDAHPVNDSTSLIIPDGDIDMENYDWSLFEDVAFLQPSIDFDGAHDVEEPALKRRKTEVLVLE
jgi:hypothetical protein